MQSKTSSSSNQHIAANVPFWKNPGRIILDATIAVLISWVLFSIVVAGRFEINTTAVTLKPEGCAVILRYGFHPYPTEISGTCAADVPFRANLVGTGGRIYLDDGSPLSLSDDQFILIGTPQHLAWTSDQKIWIGLWVLYTALLTLLGIAALYVHRTTRESGEGELR